MRRWGKDSSISCHNGQRFGLLTLQQGSILIISIFAASRAWLPSTSMDFELTARLK